jgi:hypothetical protein
MTVYVRSDYADFDRERRDSPLNVGARTADSRALTDLTATFRFRRYASRAGQPRRRRPVRSFSTCVRNELGSPQGRGLCIRGRKERYTDLSWPNQNR